MSASTAAPSIERPRHLPPVIWAGIAAGVLDILAAFVNAATRGTGPLVVLKAIATGVLGRPGFRGGPEVAALGLFLHFVIAVGWAAVYYVASRRFPILVRRPVIAGMLYGALVTTLMHHVVVPLSAAPRFAGSPSLAATAIRYGIHMFFVGLPIALVISRYARREKTGEVR